MKERMGNNREPGLKGEESVEKLLSWESTGKKRNKIMRGSRITLPFESV